MKIVYISASEIPSREANSVHIMKMCEAFAKNGHEVMLLVKKKLKNKEVKKENLFSYYGVSPIFKIKKILWPADRIGGLFYLIECRKFLSQLNKTDTLVYGRSLYGIYIATQMNFPSIYEAHTPPRSKIHFFLEKIILKTASLKKLVVITDALKKEYLKIYPFLKKEKILVAPDGANILSHDIKQKNVSNWPGRQNTIQIGYVGSLYAGKGMEIISELARIMPEIDFHIIGGKKRDIEFWKSENKNIYFHGFVPHGKLSLYYKKFNIVLAPFKKIISLSGNVGDIAKWTSPLKIFEYMAHEKPIISSNLPVLKEVLTHNKNALLCNPENINDWVNAINRLKNVNLRKFLEKNAKKDLERKYTWLKRAENVLKNINF